MRLVRLTTRGRRVNGCDCCRGREDVIECLLPYSAHYAAERSCSGGSAPGKYYDLCRHCRSAVEGLSERYVAPDTKMMETLRRHVSVGVNPEASV